MFRTISVPDDQILLSFPHNLSLVEGSVILPVNYYKPLLMTSLAPNPFQLLAKDDSICSYN